jgi:hypothetical protein
MNNPDDQTVTPNSIITTGSCSDPGFDFVTRSTIGYAAQGVMDIGQVFATISRVKDGDADSLYAAGRTTAEKLHAQAKASLAAGHTQTAHKQFLAASEGYAQAIAFADGQTEHTTFAPTFSLQTECWEAFIYTSGGRIKRIAVPYDGASLPGFLFRPDASGAKRPTVVMTNGSEGSKSGLWAWSTRYSGPRTECVHLRWPRPARSAVRQGPCLSAGLGDRSHTSRRQPGGARRRR